MNGMDSLAHPSTSGRSYASWHHEVVRSEEEGRFLLWLPEPERWPEADPDKAPHHALVERICANLRVSVANRCAAQQHNLTLESFVGLPFDAFFRHNPALGRLKLQALLNHGQRFETEQEVPMIGEEGTLPVWGEYWPILDNGYFCGMFCIHRLEKPLGSTKVSLAPQSPEEYAQALEKSERLYRELLESINEGMISVGKDFTILYFNRAAEQILAVARQKVMGRVLWKAFPVTVGSKFEQAFYRKDLTQVPARLEELYSPLDKWLELKVTTSQLGYSVYFRDITEQKKAEEEKRQVQTYLQGVFRNSIQLKFLLDTEGRSINYNRLAGEFADQVWGRRPEEGEYFPNLIQSEGNRLEFKANMTLALTGQSVSVEKSVPLTDGSRRWFEFQHMPLLDEQERIIGTIFSGMDVTARRRNERELNRLNKQLYRQNQELIAQDEEMIATNEKLLSQQDELNRTLKELSDRNFELDQLVYKTSHDLRSPMTSMMGLVALLKAENDPEKQAQYIDYIESRIHKLDGFVKDMLHYAKSSRVELTPEALDLRLMAEKCLEDIRHLPLFDKVNASVVELNPDTPFFNDRFRLDIVLSNIISNSIKYANPFQERPFLEIKIERRAEEAVIRIDDNGIGIEASYLNRVFDMFVRATDTVEGTGLGLYIVKQAVERMKGQVSIESKPNRGTTIVLTLPNLPPPPEMPPAES